jgi:magnesium transporter
MDKISTRRTEKIGLPPGTLMHIGQKKVEEPKITLTAYNQEEFLEKTPGSLKECFPLKEEFKVNWINLAGLHQTELLKEIGSYFDIHPLVLEDILNTTERPKLEDYGRYLFFLLKRFHLSPEAGEIEIEQVALVLGDKYLLSFEEKENEAFKPVREQLRIGKNRLRSSGADYLAYSLIDLTVDQYFAVLEKLGEEIEVLEVEVVEKPERETLEKIHHLKRKLLLVRKSIWALREVLNSLERIGSPLMEKETLLYLRDVYDHTIEIIDTVETYREMLSGMLDVYLSSLSNRLNEVMKVLTIIATIFMPLTFIAGVYGMNFKYMPELYWKWGYPVTWLIMLAIGFSMYYYFKRRGWL